MNLTHASAGATIRIPGAHTGTHERTGTILSVDGSGDRERYMVRWEDGHTSLFIPSGSATIVPPGTDPSRQAG